MRDWKYIPNWNKKNLTCVFCGKNKSVKYAVTVKDIDGKECKVPCCNTCIVHRIATMQLIICEEVM